MRQRRLFGASAFLGSMLLAVVAIGAAGPSCPAVLAAEAAAAVPLPPEQAWITVFPARVELALSNRTS